MNVNHRQAVRRVFMDVADLPHAEQADALDRACEGDMVLRAEVDALLAADREADGFMSTPPASYPPYTSYPTELISRIPGTPYPGETPGTRIGPYTLMELIGEGGFGSVFLAEQEKPVARRVALKIIKLGMDTRQVIARFEAERQALVILEHPNIARVLDAGATETGRPYFVMELVKGEPIDDYCDRNRLSVPDRLELFAQVCGAIQHAHTKGIIHRDIKSSNILVATIDNEPSAKVIDFGIAKATGSKLTDKTLYTEHRQLIGTPEYMSPEQAEGNMDIDTRTDVYSLGVLLYELLTGSIPFDTRQLRSASYDEMRRIIREVEPPKPSTCLSRDGDTLVNAAAARQIEPRKLGSVIRGELDWIVMKAMEKERSRRYESASALAMDVRRYLNDEAVVAAPPSTVYRVHKFARRHRVGVLAGSAVATALIVGMAAFAWQATIARQQRDIARDEAARATAMNSFMEKMLTATDPLLDGSRDVTMVDVLSKASASAREALAGQPLVEAHARSLLGKMYQSVGKPNEALPELERGLALLETAGVTSSMTLAATYRQLGHLLSERGQVRDALPRYQRAHEIILSLGPGHDIEVALGFLDLAKSHIRLAQFAEAERAVEQYELIVNRADEFPPEMRGYALNIRSSLAENLRNDPALAEKLLTEQVALYRGLGKPVLLAEASGNLALLKMRVGKFDEAKLLFAEGLEQQRTLYGETHPQMAIVLENLGNLHFRLKEFEQAQALLAQVLTIRESAFGVDSMQAARTRHNMSALAVELADFARARELSEGVLPVFRKNAGEKSLEYASSLRIHATCLKEQGDVQTALAEFQTALAVFDAVTPPSSSARMRVLQEIVEIQCRMGAVAQAERNAALATAALNAQIPDQAKWITTFEELVAGCRPASKP